MTVILDACQTTVPVGFEANCTAAEAPGDPVVFSKTTAGTVERLYSNTYDNRLVVGIIVSKSSDTECIVVTMGILEGIAAGLSEGLPVWISETGGVTTTRPPSGDLQIIGNAVGTDAISVNIEMRKTRVSP